jgi:hypothetical protein
MPIAAMILFHTTLKLKHYFKDFVMNQADRRARQLSLRVYKKPSKAAGCVITPKRTDIEIVEAQRAYCLRKVRCGY